MSTCASPSEPPTPLDALDRRIVLATQGGLPLVVDPYRAVAERLGIDTDTLLARLRALEAAGVLRRVALVPNHYALGYIANAMTVWDVADEVVHRLGRRVAALGFVSHCYLRRRHPPDWPYNLFAMVHGRSREETEAKRAHIAALLGPHCRGHDVLYSSRILKKTGLRLSAAATAESKACSA
ncbi:MAG: protein NirH [Gammaproteobacteria bacterium]|nr:MAG: protein NirH [Gammaproteobacteria bacterium]